MPNACAIWILLPSLVGCDYGMHQMQVQSLSATRDGDDHVTVQVGVDCYAFSGGSCANVGDVCVELDWARPVGPDGGVIALPDGGQSSLVHLPIGPVISTAHGCASAPWTDSVAKQISIRSVDVIPQEPLLIRAMFVQDGGTPFVEDAIASP